MENRACHKLKKRKETEGEMDPLDQKEAQGKQSIRSTQGKVLEPSTVSVIPTLNPLNPVDGENAKCRTIMHSTPIVKPQGPTCSKCSSVLDELKKMKSKMNAMKKKLSVKIGTINKMRNMLEEAENKAKVLTSRALSAELALTASEARAQEAEAKLAETEAKFAEADARAHDTKVKLLEIDVRAQKSEVKACKFEVKLKEAEGWAQKAMSELAKTEQRAHRIEEKLTEALKRACCAEEKIMDIEARMKESQRRDEGGVARSMQTVTVRRTEKPEARIKEELAEAASLKPV